MNNTAKAAKPKHASHSQDICGHLWPPKKQHRNVDISSDQQGSIQTDDPAQSSSEDFNIQCANSDNPDNNESSPSQVDNCNHISPHEMPGPSMLQVVASCQANSWKEAMDISHFYERGNKKTGKKAECITCQCVLDELEINIPYTNIWILVISMQSTLKFQHACCLHTQATWPSAIILTSIIARCTSPFARTATTQTSNLCISPSTTRWNWTPTISPTLGPVSSLPYHTSSSTSWISSWQTTR